MASVIGILIGALGVVYSYFLYPAILMILADRGPAARAGAARNRPMSLIIAARNEERRIAAKIEQSLALREHYPELEIIVASDASDDASDDIVRSFADRGVRLVRSATRLGKEHAQGLAIASAANDVLLFSDVATTIEADSIQRLDELFDDATIGAVSSVDRLLTADSNASGEGLYVRYEMWLRSLESRTGGLIGLSGSFFAVRRNACSVWDTDIPSDFGVAINVCMLGLRAVSDGSVVGIYEDVREPDEEFARKVRTIIRGMAAVARKLEVLNPVRYGLFAFEVWSHKVMRWAVPWFGLLYVGAAVQLALTMPAAIALLAPVLVLLALAVAGRVRPTLRESAPVRLGYYLVQVNLAVMVAAVRFVLGQRVQVWEPTRR